MEKKINLNSQEWCDIVFNGKNKSYGAYKMRMTSSKRHIVAFGVAILAIIAVMLIPTIMGKITAANMAKIDGVDEKRVMTVIEMDKPEEIIETAMPEPPMLREEVRNSITFTPPVIGEDSQVDNETTPHTMEDLLADGRAIGFVDVDEGTDDPSAELVKKEQIIVEEPVNKVFPIAEVMPQFPGGEQEMMKYISSNLRYPVVDQENGVQGRVIIRFVVTKTGEIDQIEIQKGVSPSCDREAMRVVKSMPKWIPGRQNGKPVAVYFTLPVLYRLK